MDRGIDAAVSKEMSASEEKKVFEAKDLVLKRGEENRMQNAPTRNRAYFCSGNDSEFDFLKPKRTRASKFFIRTEN